MLALHLIEKFLEEEYSDFQILDKKVFENEVHLEFFNRKVKIFFVQEEYSYLIVKVSYQSGFKESYRVNFTWGVWRYF